MIRARHTLFGRVVAGFYAGPLLDRAFREVCMPDKVEDPGLPLLMLANHFCWWDGFIQYRLNRACFGRKLYVMMLEEQLEKHPILARCGCFSVRKHSRSILESLDYAAEVMRSPENMLLIFPQGAIRSLHLDTPGFESGVGYLRKRVGNDHTVVLNVNLPDYGSGRKPSLNCYLRMLHGTEAGTVDMLRGAWERFYADCKKRQQTLP